MHAGRHSCLPTDPVCAGLLAQNYAMCSTCQSPPSRQKNRGLNDATVVRKCVIGIEGSPWTRLNHMLSYTCASEWGKVNSMPSKRGQSLTPTKTNRTCLNAKKHNKCHKSLRSCVVQHSPLRVSCCLAACRWLVLHPGPPCLS